jgi:hypothetical protein
LILAKKRRKRTVRWFLTAATANVGGGFVGCTPTAACRVRSHAIYLIEGFSRVCKPELRSFAVAAMETAGIYDKMKDLCLAKISPLPLSVQRSTEACGTMTIFQPNGATNETIAPSIVRQGIADQSPLSIVQPIGMASAFRYIFAVILNQCALL